MALLVGIGLGFIYPILEVAQADREVTEAPGILARFIDFYSLLGILFTLEFLILGLQAK
jgi:subfamily B ATP-binding cassette protein MsbA